MNLRAFGKRLRSAREHAGKSVAEAARAVKVSETTWRRWEAGKIEPSAKAGLRAEFFLRVSGYWLWTGDGPRELQLV